MGTFAERGQASREMFEKIGNAQSLRRRQRRLFLNSDHGTSMCAAQ